MRRPRAIRTLLAATLALAPATLAGAGAIKRKPLTLRLFLRPFKPQTVTPQLFGLLPENEYLQREIHLTPAQKQRMRQIEMQLTRVSTVLQQEDVVKALGISKTQLRRFEKLRSETRRKAEKLAAEFRELRAKLKKQNKRPKRKDLLEFRKRAVEIDAGFDKKVLNLLTRGQRDEFAKLRGKAIVAAKIFNKPNLLKTDIPGVMMVNQSYLRSRPFEPQSSTPKVFGILADIAYLQRQMNLTPSQKRRMRQIEIQLTRDSWILMEKDVRSELAISKTQFRRISQLRSQSFTKFNQSHERFRQLWKKAQATKDRKELKKLRKQMHAQADKSKSIIGGATDTTVLKVLTEAQQKKLFKLKGKAVNPIKIFQPTNRSKANLQTPDI